MATCMIAMPRAFGGGSIFFLTAMASALAFQSTTTLARAPNAVRTTAVRHIARMTPLIENFMISSTVGTGATAGGCRPSQNGALVS